MIKLLLLNYSNASFQKKITYAFAIASILPLSILSFVIIVQSISLYNSSNSTIMNNSMEQIQQNLEEKIFIVNKSMKDLTYEKNLAQFFSDPPASLYSKYMLLKDSFDVAVANTLTTTELIQTVNFYSNNPELDFRENILQINKSTTPIWIIKSKFTETPTWIINKNRLFIVNNFVYNENGTSAIEITVSLERLMSGLVSPSQQFAYTISQDENLIYQSNNSDNPDYHFKRSIPLSISGWKINFFVNNNTWLNFFLSSTMLLLFAIFINILLSILVARFFSSQLLATVQLLKNKVKSVSSDNFNVDFSTTQQDEMGELSNLLGDMMRRIQYLVSEIYETTIDKQESEYKALTNQINSHFLYNTLSMMNWKALMAGQSELSDIIQTLSKYYRTTLNHGKSYILLEDELENVIMYVNLRLFLKPNSFKFHYFICDSLKQTQVINLMLQPIIENAIDHGFAERSGNAKIFLTMQADYQNRLVITVADNGIGIAAPVIQTLLTPKSKGYGLNNINKRIKFYFGPQYGLTIHSKEGYGTKITILLPLPTQSN
jgi:two-component system sensor histidine kinase YesM